MSCHPASVYTTLQSLLVAMDCLEDNELQKKRKKFWIKYWNGHIDKHGNVPLVMKCQECSGREYKRDLKDGKYRVRRPTKAERDEQKGIVSEEETV